MICTMLLWKWQEAIHLIKIRHDIKHMNPVQSVYIIAIPPAGDSRFMGIYPSGLQPSQYTYIYSK